ncbi:MAG: hypothetical protein U0838_02190 [Chloroflexota bacterium]
MATIVYLDVEDEITTAAARIRNAGEKRVGLVVPYGSRVATSRINFRLLAREAQDAGRRLDIVAPDASARALAASAGIPVFASVGEYEAALATGADTAEMEAAAPPKPKPGASAGAKKAAAAGAAGAAGVAAGATGAAAARTQQRRFLDDDEPEDDLPPAGRGRHTVSDDRDMPVAKAKGRSLRGPLILLVAILAVALGFGGVAAATLLPTAEITVTPQMEPVTPVSLTVRADPALSAVDEPNLAIPATEVSVPLTAQGDFSATGTNVVQTSSTGQVTFDSINTVNAMPIARGTRVATSDGIAFVTTAAITVPRATVDLNTITHGRASVGIVAVEKGPKGNVAAGSIDQVPSSLASLQISVSNGAATSGGTRTETPKIAAEDVKAATEALTQDLTDQVAAAVSDPSIVPSGATAYPDTAKLGDITYTPDAAALEGKVLKANQTTFGLQADATATVIAVDESPLKQLGDSAIRAAVKQGYQIEPDSISITVSPGTVGEDGSVSYTITATALQHRPLDEAALRTSVLGKTPDEAKAALGQYGKVDVVLGPFWVSTIPTNADKVTLTIKAPERPAATPTPPPTATPRPTPRPTKSTKPSAPAPSETAPDASPVPSA